MVDEKIKVYTPETIQDAPFPQEGVVGFDTKSTEGVFTPTQINDSPLPEKKVANELLSSVLNTQSRKILAEFQFTRYGGLQIGEYTNQVSGDIRISPSGIVARNMSGVTTFALDGETGDASFLGEVKVGSLVSALINGDRIIVNTLDADRIMASNIDVAVDVGTGTGGAYVRLDGANNRIIIHDGTNPRIVIGNA